MDDFEACVPSIQSMQLFGLNGGKGPGPRLYCLGRYGVHQIRGDDALPGMLLVFQNDPQAASRSSSEAGLTSLMKTIVFSGADHGGE